jgi:hypothetical protein
MSASDVPECSSRSGNNCFGFAGQVFQADVLSPITVGFIQANGYECGAYVCIRAAGK